MGIRQSGQDSTLFLRVTADFCFVSLSPHPSISSLVRQCEIVQIRSPYPYSASRLQGPKHSEGAFFALFCSLSLLSPDSMFCVWCNGPIITLSDFFCFCPLQSFSSTRIRSLAFCISRSIYLALAMRSTLTVSAL